MDKLPALTKESLQSALLDALEQFGHVTVSLPALGPTKVTIGMVRMCVWCAASYYGLRMCTRLVFRQLTSAMHLFHLTVQISKMDIRTIRMLTEHVKDTYGTPPLAAEQPKPRRQPAPLAGASAPHSPAPAVASHSDSTIAAAQPEAATAPPKLVAAVSLETIATPYGVGTLKERRADGVVIVTLPWATAFINPLSRTTTTAPAASVASASAPVQVEPASVLAAQVEVPAAPLATAVAPAEAAAETAGHFNTPYGVGKLLRTREDGVLIVQLPWATAFINPNSRTSTVGSASAAEVPASAAAESAAAAPAETVTSSATAPAQENVQEESPVQVATVPSVFVRLTVGAAGSHAESKVCVAGSWDGWADRHELQLDDGVFTLAASTIAAPGSYSYKFIVDGNWVTDPSQAVVDDGAGNLNHHLAF